MICIKVLRAVCIVGQEKECWRAAVDLTGRLLTQCGQGLGKVGTPSQHTTFSLKVSPFTVNIFDKPTLFEISL